MCKCLMKHGSGGSSLHLAHIPVRGLLPRASISAYLVLWYGIDVVSVYKGDHIIQKLLIPAAHVRHKLGGWD